MALMLFEVVNGKIIVSSPVMPRRHLGNMVLGSIMFKLSSGRVLGDA